MNEMVKDAMDKRRHDRISAPVRVIAKGQELEAEVWFDIDDISPGGFYLVSDFLFEKGTEFSMVFSLPGSEEELTVKGKVAWVNMTNDNANGKPAGMGIAFDSLDRDEQEILNRFFSENR